MSRSESQGRVALTSNNPAVQFRLVDQHQQIIARGDGHLTKSVRPGIYRIEVDSGPVVAEKLIAIDSGESYEDHQVAVSIPTAAPIETTSTYVPEHGKEAHDLSTHPTHRRGSGGRLVVFVRTVPEGDAPPGPVSLSDFSVHLDGNELGLAEGRRGDTWGGLSIDLDPGGYRLITHTQSGAIAQSLWVTHGWTTYAFVAQPYPDDRRRDFFAAQMGTTEMPYRPKLYKESQSALTAEIVLSGLRRGEKLIPDQMLDAMLHDKFVNPFLGILGAHALLAGAPRWSLFDLVVRNLKKLVPGHPDVTSLFVMGKSRRGNQVETRGRAVTWPPMLYSAYKGLIDRSLIEEALIEAGSIAESAASWLLPEGPWTRWNLTKSEAMGPEGFDRFIKQKSEAMSKSELDRVGSVMEKASHWLASVSDPGDTKYDQAVVEQVARYVTAFATEDDEPFDPSQIASQVRLPQRAVKEAIRALDTSQFATRFK